MRMLVCAAVAAVFLAACGGKSTYVKKGEMIDRIDQEAVTRNDIEAIGIGGADPEIPNATQRRALSRNAAIVAAQYEMLSMVKGVELEGGIRVERAMEADSVLQTKIDAAIAGAEIVSTEWTNDDGCVVKIRLPKKRLEEMMGVKFK